MYTVVYTKSLDHANDMVAKSYEYANKNDAINLFNERVSALLDKVLNNEFLNCNFSISNHKAMIKIVDEHYCIAVVSDEDMLKPEPTN